MNIRELIKKHFELENEVCSDEGLASMLMFETESVTNGETDNHRWYSITPKVAKLCDVFVSFYQVHADGDNDWYDCVMPCEILDGAKVVEQRTRTVVETYYVPVDE
jgi:hypothetical protein